MQQYVLPYHSNLFANCNGILHKYGNLLKNSRYMVMFTEVLSIHNFFQNDLAGYVYFKLWFVWFTLLRSSLRIQTRDFASSVLSYVYVTSCRTVRTETGSDHSHFLPHF